MLPELTPIEPHLINLLLATGVVGGPGQPGMNGLPGEHVIR